MKIAVIAGWMEPERLIGTLDVSKVRGTERIMFEVDKEWIQNNPSLMIDPDLAQFSGPQYPPADKKMFGFLEDASPDRWGRKLIERNERLIAGKEGRSVRSLNDSDYLLGVSDYLRYGGLRFQNLETGEFLSSSDASVPPITEIKELEAAARGYELSDRDEMAVHMLLSPGSSLGGARPKANVRDTDGSLWIAKFPSKKDDYDIGAWEMVEHDLAKMCGINVPDAKTLKLSEYGSTFLSKRFDRIRGRRIHLMSAMTALGKTDGNTQGIGYLDLAGCIEEISINPESDLQELWKRMLFNILASNCDDHLRNHGFLLDHNGWRLSPAYDLNPVSGKEELSLNITDTDNRRIPENAIEVSEFFRVSHEDAISIKEKMKSIISHNWRDLAVKNHIKDDEIKYMEAAYALNSQHGEQAKAA